jgi:serine/threonine-protein kinase
MRYCRQCGLELQKTQTTGAPTAASEGPRPTIKNPTGQQSQTTNNLAGRTIDQRYYIEGKIGSGGMGTVYRARRLLIGDTAAIKVLHPGLMTDPSAVERFRREAQAAARLKHPNAMSIYDFGISNDGLVYLVMELVEGENLSEIINERGTISVGEAAEIIRQVCSALDEAHRQNVVHRDLKPENIIVQDTQSGLRVKVLDFGIASLRDLTSGKLTQAGVLVGTPHYMSPEQCLGEALDGRSDIYSLGIVLYEMLTGVTPFDSPTPTAIVVMQVNHPPRPLREILPRIPPAVESVVLHALEKRREARPQSASDLAREMLAAISSVTEATSQPAPVASKSETVTAPERTPTSVVAVPTRADSAISLFPPPADKGAGSRVLLLAGLFLVLAIAAGIVLWWWYSRRSGVESPPTESGVAAISQQTAAPLESSSSPEAVSPETGATTKPQSLKLWQVISDQTISASDAENATGEPDRKVATIGPGGQLAIAFQAGQFFGNGDGADLRVFGPEGESVSYIIFVRDDPGAAWQRVDINRRGFPQGVVGHDIGHHGVQRARQVMIRNTGSADLHFDAVTAVYKDFAGSAQHSHQHR